ncbi:MAG TPA: SUMF1/EgtB/PvdO family nonheme iron enzyme [Polyangiaceae bacterium]|nr:SUMF1/EgtB/PvdO family nonheme iron enzyme [Polyangiaceae bacterium]
MRGYGRSSIRLLHPCILMMLWLTWAGLSCSLDRSGKSAGGISPHDAAAPETEIPDSDFPIVDVMDDAPQKVDGQAGSSGQGDSGVGGNGQAGSSVQAGAAGSAIDAGINVVCPDKGGKMVALPGGVCIDKTEVTRAAYSAWQPMAVKDMQPKECQWNESVEPDPQCMNHPKDVCKKDCDEHPQVCIDWCDAWLFCRSHGKRLCGSWSTASSTDIFDDYDDEEKDVWYYACSSGGANDWTFGDQVPEPRPCNFGHNSDSGSTVAAGSMMDCQSPNPLFAGVFDLTGNAAEWQDSCAASKGKKDDCRLRGGSYDCGAPSNRCDSERVEKRDTASFATGFRCCWP